jgi:lipoprotein-releasing system permease protein
MIVTVAITTGFQREVRAKVTGAGSHLQITSIRQTDPKETPRLPIDRPYYPWLDTLPQVAHIQIYATKPGIIETAGEIQGVVVKGVGRDHDWSFLHSHLVEGSLPAIGDTSRPIDLLLSRYLGRRLDIAVGDTITVYLVRGREDIRPRRFHVSGFYETGLEQLDHQLVYIDIEHLQRFSLWGLKAELQLRDDGPGDAIRIEGLAFGGDRIHRYHWPGTDLDGKGPHTLCITGDSTITLVVSDAAQTLPDTAWIRFRKVAGATGGCLGPAEVNVERGGSGGSHKLYTGGFEIMLHDHRDVDDMDQLVYHDYLEVGERSLSVRDRFPEIFAWLELLDTNVVVVIILMVIVAIINMTSALLIIILERTAMIGVLKALGAGNAQIRRIFLIQAAYILAMGLAIGDAVGIGACLLQQRFGIVTLPVESYYVDAVPVSLDLWPILLLNAGTLGICLLALILPSMLVTRIAPVRAIKFA